MNFHKIPSSALLNICSLGAYSPRTDRETDGMVNFLESYVLITIPSGFDEKIRMKLGSRAAFIHVSHCWTKMKNGRRPGNLNALMLDGV